MRHEHKPLDLQLLARKCLKGSALCAWLAQQGDLKLLTKFPLPSAIKQRAPSTHFHFSSHTGLQPNAPFNLPHLVPKGAHEGRGGAQHDADRDQEGLDA